VGRMIAERGARQQRQWLLRLAGSDADHHIHAEYFHRR